MEEQLTPVQKAQMANQIADLDQQITKLGADLAKAEQQIATTKGRKQQSFQTEASNLRQQRANLLQEANTLRAQLGLPMVIPASNPSPQVTQVIVQQQKRGGCLRNILIALGVLVLVAIIASLANNGREPSKPAASNTLTNQSQEKGAVSDAEVKNTPTPEWLAPPFEEICETDSTMTDVQQEEVAKSMAGKKIVGWVGKIYDVERSSDKFTVQVDVAGGIIKSRQVEISDVARDLAVKLNVDQQIRFDGTIQSIEMFAGSMCNPIKVADATITPE